MRIKVSLNGTNNNPYHKYGLRQNPFPQIAEHKYYAACMHLQALDGDPIPDTDFIRRHLAGWFSQEFIDLCCIKFVKGEIVQFEVEWRD